jgi:hypothetical protein
MHQTRSDPFNRTNKKVIGHCHGHFLEINIFLQDERCTKQDLIHSILQKKEICFIRQWLKEIAGTPWAPVTYSIEYPGEAIPLPLGSLMLNGTIFDMSKM